MYINTPTPQYKQYVTKGQFFDQNLAALNSEFSLNLIGCHTMVKEPSLSIAGGRIVRYVAFPRILAHFEMQTASSRN